jgi:hypothetical protein
MTITVLLMSILTGQNLPLSLSMTPHRLAKQQHKHTRKSFWGTTSERSIAVPLKAHANERATDTCCRHRRAEIKRIARPEYGLHGLRRNRCGYTPNWNGPTRSLVTTARVPFSSIGSTTNSDAIST